jgi:hypothetical protein
MTLISGLFRGTASRLDRFLFAPVLPGRLGIVRAAFYAHALWTFGGRDLSGWAAMDAVVWEPIGLFALLDLRPIDAATMNVLSGLFTASMLLACLGLWTRASTIASFVLGYYCLGMGGNFLKVAHGSQLPLIVMAILMCSRCGDAFSLDALWRRWHARRQGRGFSVHVSGEYQWPIRVVWVAFALAFMACGLFKLFGNGWLHNDGLRYVWLMHGYRGFDMPSMTSWLLHSTMISSVLAKLTLVIEIGAPALLFSRRARWFLVASLFLMQVGNGVLIGVHADLPWGGCYLFFVDFAAMAYIVPTPLREAVGAGRILARRTSAA